MEIMKPFDVTDTTLTSSSIAEPDIASGEVEWVNPNIPVVFSSFAQNYDCSELGSDGFIYCAGGPGAVLSIDTDNKTTSTFGSYTQEKQKSAVAYEDFIYFVGGGFGGINGDVLKLDVTTSGLSTFGNYNGVYFDSKLSGNGSIYCVGDGDAGNVMKINPVGDSLSFFGVVTGVYLACEFDLDGFLYCVGETGVVLKVNVLAETVSTFGVYSGTYNTATLGDDGFIYCVGNANTVLKINTKDDTVTTFGSYSGFLPSAVKISDGNIYCVGLDKAIVIDVTKQTVSNLAVFVGSYATSTVGTDGGIYSVGNSANGVLFIGSGYEAGNEVIKTSTSRVYKAATITRDDPEVGVTLVPPSWVDLQYTNKYRMFNDAKDSKSTATSDIVTEYDFNKSVTTVATLGVIGTSVKVTVTDPVDGIVYEVEKETADAGVNDFWAFWFEPYTFREDLVFDNMPPGYPDTTVKVEVEATSGERAVGRVLSGLPVNIGTTNEPTTVGRQNFTLRTRDGFGNLTITPKRSIKVLNYDVAVNKNDLDSTDRILESVGKIPALYIGEGDLESMICFGMAEDYRMDHNSAFSNMRLEVKEI